MLQRIPSGYDGTWRDYARDYAEEQRQLDRFIGEVKRGPRRSRRWIAPVFPGLRMQIMKPALIAVLLGGAALGALYWAGISRAAEIERALKCARSSITFTDERRHPVGFTFRADGCQEKTGRVRSTPVREGDLRDPRQSKPYQAMRILEGEFLSSIITLGGVDWTGPVRAIFKGKGGGSSPIVSAGEQIAGQPKGNLIQRLLAKLKSYAGTVVFVHRHLKTDTERLRFVLENTTCVTSSGRDIAGSECTWIMFRKRSFAKLTDGEACLWAATAMTPLIARWGFDEKSMVQDRLERVRTRARYCARKRAERDNWGDIRLQRVLREIGKFQPTVIINKDGDYTILSYAAGIPGLSYGLIDELRLAGLEKARTARLTIDAKGQSRLVRKMESVKRTAGSLNLCRGYCQQNRLKIRMILSVHEIMLDGRVLMRLGYTSGHYQLTGRIEKDPESGKWLNRNSTNPVGSLNKPWIALLAEQAGMKKLCNRSFEKIINANGDSGVANCNSGKGLVPLGTALAQSMNLPFLAASRKIGWGNLSLSYKALGYRLPESRADYPGLVLGYAVTASPQILIRNWAALDRGTRGSSASAYLPSMLAQFQRSQPINLGRAGFGNLTAARGLLAKPLTHPRGTLRRLAAIIKRRGCTPGIGKSGTTQASGTRLARDRLALVSFACSGRHYVAFARFGMVDDIPMPRKARGVILKMIKSAIQALTGKDARK